MFIVSWLKSESAAEKLLAHAFVEMEMGSEIQGLTDLVQGIVDLAPASGKAAALLGKVQTLLVTGGYVNAPVAPAPSPVTPPAPAAPIAPAPPTAPPVAAPVEPAAAVAGS